ncbi:MAG: protein-L-isoaspartate(D-aspartate) O-methyltransferase [Porticoccaceae bacterium]|nr:protein-L-isoaspartate(D-aspartate) O-methyltransferase [Porticoccaceae bacterium]
MTSQRTRERLIQRLEDQGISSQAVLDVIRMTPRHLFVDEALSHRAYEDTALPIGFAQTLSQPYVVARMTEALLSDGPLQRVLEIGTGSGYQTVVLSQLVAEVVSVERIEPLLKKARERFRKLRLTNITASLSDGSFGWEEQAPYNGIISTAAPQAIPQQLLQQLAPNGILVIPVGGEMVQDLRVIRRLGDSNEFDEDVIEKVRFVPLLGGVTRSFR